jgi:hypothetical protein
MNSMNGYAADNAATANHVPIRVEGRATLGVLAPQDDGFANANETPARMITPRKGRFQSPG